MARILVLEDDLAQAEFLALAMTEAGHHLSVVHTAQDAIEICEVHDDSLAFDLIVTDMIIREGDRPIASGGLSLTSRIRLYRPGAPSWWRNVPIIAITGVPKEHPSVDLLALARSLGASAVLRKPFPVDQLLDTVNEALRFRREAPA